MKAGYAVKEPPYYDKESIYISVYNYKMLNLVKTYFEKLDYSFRHDKYCVGVWKIKSLKNEKTR